MACRSNFQIRFVTMIGEGGCIFLHSVSLCTRRVVKKQRNPVAFVAQNNRASLAASTVGDELKDDND